MSMGHGFTRRLEALKIEAQYDKDKGKEMSVEEEHLLNLNEEELFETGAKLLNAVFAKRRRATLDSASLVKGLFARRGDVLLLPPPVSSVRPTKAMPTQSRVQEAIRVPGTTRDSKAVRAVSESSRTSRDSWHDSSDYGSDRVSAAGSDSSYSRQRPEKDERKTYSQATGGARSSGGKGDSKGRGRPTGK